MCDRRTDMYLSKINYIKHVTNIKKMRGGVFGKNIWEGASERRNENKIVSGSLKIDMMYSRVLVYIPKSSLLALYIYIYISLITLDRVQKLFSNFIILNK
jgi:hypothetical protein